mmetsp:Transcript_25535/g.81246  ORF Transcript_25535/g.81246 Transcript_25535/m.81246 type:complete len:601 (-) Transcript_25535:44-1846(-)
MWIHQRSSCTTEEQLVEPAPGRNAGPGEPALGRLGRHHKVPTAKRSGASDSNADSHPGLNYGFPDRGVYIKARKMVLEREKELEHLESPGAHKFKLEKENDYKVVRYYHYLHGKVYDLREFYEHHPGGEGILRMSAGLPDATSLFESYHAFANRDGILQRLQQYEVTDDDEALERAPAQLFSFDEGGFYDTVVKRVRARFGATTDKLDESVMANVKADKLWAAKVGTQLALNLVTYLLAFVLRLPAPVAMVFAFLSGWFQIQWGFTAFHDASHFAIAPRNHWSNDVITRVWAAWSLWHCRIWMSHHVALHHTYTGSPSLDPDVQHATPMVRKTADTPHRKVNGFFTWIGDKMPGMSGWTIAAVLIYVLTPGMWLGQVRGYAMYRLSFLYKYLPWFTDLRRCERLWGMRKYDDLRGYDTLWWEFAIFWGQIAFQVARGSLLVTMAYFVSLNLFYSMCIVADHDLAESAITNHVDFEPVHKKHSEHHNGGESPSGEKVERVPDWGEMQVRNTTNFLNSKLNFFGRTMGNINFQIEHHLFPGMSHMHLPKVATIVCETCEEFGIPYTTYPSLTDAWYSFLITLRAVMTAEDTNVVELERIQHL